MSKEPRHNDYIKCSGKLKWDVWNVEWVWSWYEFNNRSYRNNYEFKIGSEVGIIDENLSSIKGDGGKDVCKVTTKVEDFDEAMPIVQVQVGNLEVRDVLLNGGFHVNIIFENLRKNFNWFHLWCKWPTNGRCNQLVWLRTWKSTWQVLIIKFQIIVLKMENRV